MLGLNAKSTSNKRQEPNKGNVGTASSESLHQKEHLKKKILDTGQKEVEG